MWTWLLHLGRRLQQWIICDLHVQLPLHHPSLFDRLHLWKSCPHSQGGKWLLTQTTFIMQFHIVCIVQNDSSPLWCLDYLHFQAAASQQDSASTQKAEKEVTRMCVLMVCGFMIAWTPYASLAAWIFFNKGIAFTAQSMAIPAFFSKSSALFNPIIYVLMNKQVGNMGFWSFLFSVQQIGWWQATNNISLLIS